MRHFIVLLFVFVGLSSSATLPAYDLYYSGSLDSSAGYEELKQFIEKTKVQSPNQLLSEFSKDPKWQRYLEFFVLLYSSSSAQRSDVSPEYPRIISHFGRLVLGLTGTPSEAGGRHYNRIEVMEFSPKTASFHFRVIDFSRKGAERFIAAPKDCKNCHGNPSRPIWHTYPLWPGVYGGNDDTLTPDKETREASLWSKFFHGNRKNDRYSYFKFGEEYNFDNANARYLADGFTRFVPSMPLLQRSSLRLSTHFGEMNQRRIDREVAQSPIWDTYKFALSGAVLGCSSIEDFLPEGISTQHMTQLGMDFSQLKKTIFHSIGANSQEKEALFRQLSGSAEKLRPGFDLPTINASAPPSVLFYPDHFTILTNLAFLLEGSPYSGVKVKNWGMDYHPFLGSDSYALDLVAQFFGSEWPTVIQKIQSDPAFEDLPEGFPRISPGLVSSHGAVCDALKERSLRSFGG